MKKTIKGGAMLAPVPPAIVTCGSVEKPNMLTVAWTGMLATVPPTTYISVRPERFSYHIIKESGEFVINLCTEKLVPVADFSGVRSGRDTDKFAVCGVHAEPSPNLSLCPSLSESPVNIQCKVRDMVHLGSHDMFIADIVGISVDESLWDKNGKIHLDKAGLAAYAHGEYFALGKKLGSFGYTVKKKKKKR